MKCGGLEWCEMGWDSLKFILQSIYFMTWMLDFETNMTWLVMYMNKNIKWDHKAIVSMNQ